MIVGATVVYGLLASPAPVEWYYAIGRDRQGPVNQVELGRLATAGEVSADTLVWREGMPQWKPYREVSNDQDSCAADAASVVSPTEKSRIRIPSLKPGEGTMPLPDEPVVRDYGRGYVEVGHDIHLFPAILKDDAAVKAREILEEGEVSCFYHPHFAATAVCDHSGRFICDLCAVEWDSGTVSLQALEEMKWRGENEKLRDGCTLWDDIALALATFPLLTFFLPIITAPIALFICIWKWRAGPTSITRRSRWRYILAGALSVVQIVVIVMLFIR